MGAQQALDDLFAKCRKDQACNSHFPRFHQRFEALLKRLDEGPIRVPVTITTGQIARERTVALSNVRLRRRNL